MTQVQQYPTVQAVNRELLAKGIFHEIEATREEVKEALMQQFTNEAEMDERVIAYTEKFAEYEKARAAVESISDELEEIRKGIEGISWYSSSPKHLAKAIATEKVEEVLKSEYPMTHMCKSIIRAKLELMTDAELQEYTLEDLIEDLFFVDEESSNN